MKELQLDHVRWIHAVLRDRRVIVETAIASTEEDALVLRLRGFKQSSLDPEVWNLWQKQ